MRVPANLVNGSNVQLTERLHECVVVNGVGQKAAEIFAGQSERLDQGWVFEVRVCRHHLGAEAGSRGRACFSRAAGRSSAIHVSATSPGRCSLATRSTASRVAVIFAVITLWPGLSRQSLARLLSLSSTRPADELEIDVVGKRGP